MSAMAYPLFQVLVIAAAVGFSAWRVWRTYAPKRRKIASEPGCDAGCPSCNHCTTTDAPPPPGATPRLRKNERPLEFRPRPR